MREIEKEDRYLLKQLPISLLDDWRKETIVDIYYPNDSDNPQIRLRQRGSRYLLTKKCPLVDDDLGTMVEETIRLSEEEKNFLDKHLPGKIISKNRYSKDFQNYKIEIDEYLGDLKPLAILDVEWRKNRGEIDKVIQEFDVLKEITNISNLAAGRIAGKSYDEIKPYI